MKKILLLVAIVLLFGVNVFSQSITLKDIQGMEAGHNTKAILASKLFVLSNLGDNPEIYYKNENTSKQERVVYEKQRNGVLYSIRDLGHLKTILSDLQKQYNLILKDDSPKDSFYQFANATLSVFVNVNKVKGSASVSLSKR
jgi:hypothetical protein